MDFVSIYMIIIRVRISCTYIQLNNGQYVSQKLTTHCLIPPWSQSSALWLSISHSGDIFLLKKHMDIMVFSLPIEILRANSHWASSRFWRKMLVPIDDRWDIFV